MYDLQVKISISIAWPFFDIVKKSAQTFYRRQI